MPKIKVTTTAGVSPAEDQEIPALHISCQKFADGELIPMKPFPSGIGIVVTVGNVPQPRVTIIPDGAGFSTGKAHLTGPFVVGNRLTYTFTDGSTADPNSTPSVPSIPQDEENLKS